MEKSYFYDTNIYKQSKIKEAIKEFAWYDISLSDDCLTIKGNSEEESDLIKNELFNYVIYLMV